jgi:hypothetical protein
MGAKLRGTWPRVQLDFVRWHLIFSAITAVDFPTTYRNVDQFTCTEEKAPDDSKVLSSLQKCGFSGRNLLRVASPVSKVLKWHVHCLGICGPLCISTTKTNPVLPISRFQSSRPGVLKLFLCYAPLWESGATNLWTPYQKNALQCLK